MAEPLKDRAIAGLRAAARRGYDSLALRIAAIGMIRGAADLNDLPGVKAILAALDEVLAEIR